MTAAADRLRQLADESPLLIAADENATSLWHMSFTGDQPDMGMDDVDDLARLIRQLGVELEGVYRLAADMADALVRIEEEHVYVGNEANHCIFCGNWPDAHEEDCQIHTVRALLARLDRLAAPTSRQEHG